MDHYFHIVLGISGIIRLGAYEADETTFLRPGPAIIPRDLHDHSLELKLQLI